MKPCILFLDIDGVLNSETWFDGRREAGFVWCGFDQMLDPAAVARLNRIVDATGCQVVLTSSWRLQDEETRATEGWLRRAGFLHRLEGETPHLPGDDRRGEEVALWLAQHGEGRPYALLDDEPEDNHLGRWVATSFTTGLTDDVADQVIRRLV